MSMNYIQVEFQVVNQAELEILVALLVNAGFESFEENDATLKACIKEDSFDEELLKEILEIVPTEHAISIVPQQNWNAQWESSFEPILVNNFAAIRAGFHQPVKDVQHEIIITPKMSFGTGHHATTYMMIEQMQELDFGNKHVFDFGTGTGVLAILAEKLGASAVDAIDIDAWSIENTIENIATNQCSRIKAWQADSIPAGKQFDIILANINYNIITGHLASIKAICKEGTRVLLSGFLKTDEPGMIDALSKYGITALKTLQKGNWICISAVVS